MRKRSSGTASRSDKKAGHRSGLTKRRNRDDRAPLARRIIYGMSRLDAMHWILVFNGIADRWLWGFEADGWRLEYHDPHAARSG